MGVAGLVLGIIGAVGGFIPGINFFAWLIALIGIVISAIAMSKAKKAGQPTGITVAGLVLSIIGFVIAISGLICIVCIGAGAAAAGLW